MGLGDDVERFLDSADPGVPSRARECIHSNRMQLHHDGRAYCLLSGREGYEQCPLQAKEGKSYLKECRMKEYVREMTTKKL